MIEATLKKKDTEEMCKILKDSHLEKFKRGEKLDHDRLKRIMEYVFFDIRKEYNIKDEENERKGTVDLIYYPKNKNKAVIIIELKVKNKNTEEMAIEKIHEREYYRNLNKDRYNGNILLIKINYQNENKAYGCKIKEYKVENNELKKFYESSYKWESMNKRKNISGKGIFKRLKSSK